jgi:hypothetical protein
MNHHIYAQYHELPLIQHWDEERAKEHTRIGRKLSFGEGMVKKTK